MGGVDGVAGARVGGAESAGCADPDTGMTTAARCAGASLEWLS